MLTAPFDARELQRLWHSALGFLQVEVGVHTYATWFEGSRAVRRDDATLVVEARTPFSCDWLNSRLLPVVERALRHATGESLTAIFVPRSADDAPAVFATPVAPPPPPRRVIGLLNERFTLDSYIPTRGNEIAMAGAKACIGEAAELAMDPVVVVGEPGLGKTHLIHAIANRAANSGWPVACVTASEFTRRFVDGVKQRDQALHEDFRSIRLLAFDDLQSLEGRQKTAEEFADVIDAVLNGGGHVVIASEVDPLELNLPRRLSSRLAAGLTARVEPFSAQERRRFVEAHATFHGVELPTWAIDRLAAAAFASVRDLQGACNGAVAMHRAGTLDLASLDLAVLRVAATPAPGFRRSAAELLDLVAGAFDLPTLEIVGRGRSANVADARAAAVAVLRANGHSLPEIARALDGRDPSTISGLTARGQILAGQHPKLRQFLAS